LQTSLAVLWNRSVSLENPDVDLLIFLMIKVKLFVMSISCKMFDASPTTAIASTVEVF
jgi:hypothetical protein